MRKTTYLLLIALTTALYSQNIHAQTFERLKAQVFFQVPRDSTFFKASDSLTYFYIGNAAHDSISSGNGFDTCYRWHTNDGINYTLYSLSNDLWSADNKIQSDTVWQWDTVSHTYSYGYYSTGTYDASRNLIASLNQKRDSANTVWINQQRSHHIYNSSGQRIYTAWEISPFGTWDTTQTISSTFNSNNTLASYLTRSFVGNGILNNYYLYTYDSLSRLDTIFQNTRSSDTSNWYQQTRTIYQYDTSGDLTIQYQQLLNGVTWSNHTLQTNTYDANHNQIKAILQNADSAGNWINNIRYQNTYDSYNMKTSATQNGWDTSNGGSWKPIHGNRMYHYYYETFNLPSGIAEIAQAGQARLYPVPAADMLSLDITWNEAQPSTATIYDATGKQLSQFTLPDAATYHGYIPAYTLPAGIYTLEIKGSKGSITKSFNVLK